MRRAMDQVDVTGDGGVDASYRFAASGRTEAEDDRLTTLERLFDPESRRRRAFAQPGWRCLEIGAGRGSMAAWLARHVGEAGEVVATDIDVSFLEPPQLANLRVVEHDFLADALDVLEPGTYDLVCARLFLFHLIGREQEVVDRMAECLAPGGWLLVEEGDRGTAGPVDASHPAYEEFHAAWKAGEWWTSRGFDPYIGRKLPVLFTRAGLENVRSEVTAEVVPGASEWANWWRESRAVMRDRERSKRGLTEADERDYERLMAPCEDPTTWFLTGLIHGCRGRRAAAG